MLEPQKSDEPASVDLALDSLTHAEWVDLYLRLRNFAYKYYARLARNNTILEDLIHDSFLVAFSGQRTLPPGVPLFNFICGIMRSNTSHYFEKESRRAKLNAAGKDSKAASAERIVERENLRLDLSTIMRMVENEIKDDGELSIIHQSLISDPESKPNDIARKNDMPVGKVKNARKRYFRLVKKLLTA